MAHGDDGEGGARTRGAHAAAQVALATVAFALLHSALANARVKRRIRRAVGDRAYHGWYRLAYNAQALVTTTALAVWAWRRPDRVLWHVRGPAGALMRGGQLAALGAFGWGALELGLLGWSGLPNAAAWRRGAPEVPLAPEGQGPPFDPSGRLRPVGPYAWMRHPLNALLVPVVWLQPRMTANLAAFGAVTTLYVIAGSAHEESRQAARHPAEYAAYRRAVAFLVPRGRPRMVPNAPPAAPDATPAA